MKRALSIALLFGSAASLLGLAACETPIAAPGDVEDAAQTTDLTTIRVLLTDAPSDYIAAASVDIGRVTLIPADDGAHIVLNEDGTDGFVDLLDFQGAATMPLAEAEIDPGTFGELRMIVEAARVELIEGYTFRDGSTEMDLTVPSGAQSGLKLKLQNDEDGGPVEFVPGESVLVLDFDVSQSFVLRGNPDTPAGVHGVNFKPAIRVTAMDVAASISGVVSTDVEDFSLGGLTVVATPTDGGTVDGYQTYVGTALTADDGTYTIHYLVPGSYDVTVQVPEGFGTEPEASSVVLGNKEDLAGVDFTVIDVTGSIAGTVSTELDGVSVEGLVVTALPDAEGAEPITTETLSDGAYLFDGIVAGSYLVTVAVGEGQVTDPADAAVEVDVAEDVTAVDFAILEDLTGTISGSISTALDGVSIGGLTVSALSDADGAEAITAVTSADGAFVIEGVPAGTYTVTVAAGDGLTTSPSEIVVTVEEQEDESGLTFQVIVAG